MHCTRRPPAQRGQRPAVFFFCTNNRSFLVFSDQTQEKLFFLTCIALLSNQPPQRKVQYEWETPRGGIACPSSDLTIPSVRRMRVYHNVRHCFTEPQKIVIFPVMEPRLTIQYCRVPKNGGRRFQPGSFLFFTTPANLVLIFHSFFESHRLACSAQTVCDDACWAGNAAETCQTVHVDIVFEWSWPGHDFRSEAS